MKKYYDTDSIKECTLECIISPHDYGKKCALNKAFGIACEHALQRKIMVKATIFKNGAPLGTWTGTDFEFSQLQLAVSSTQLSFSVLEHGPVDYV